MPPFPGAKGRSTADSDFSGTLNRGAKGSLGPGLGQLGEAEQSRMGGKQPLGTAFGQAGAVGPPASSLILMGGAGQQPRDPSRKQPWLGAASHAALAQPADSPSPHTAPSQLAAPPSSQMQATAPHTAPPQPAAAPPGAPNPQVQATVDLLLAKLRALPSELRTQIAQVRADDGQCVWDFLERQFRGGEFGGFGKSMAT